MAISAVTAAAAGSTQSTSNPASAASAAAGTLLGGESQFLQLLVAQLQNQDPLNPVSGTDFTTQLAQFATVDSLTQLNSNFATQLQLQQLSQGAALIGKTISYVQSGTGTPLQGTVSSVQVNNGQLQLTVGQDTVTLAQVTGILPSS